MNFGISESHTQSDEKENTDEPTTTMEVAKDVSNVIIQDNATAAPSDQSAFLETELLPLVTNQDPATPESELIGQDCAAMEAEVQQLRDQKVEQHTQVASFPLI